MSGALDRVEWDYLKAEVARVFDDLRGSTLTLISSDSVQRDPEFGHITGHEQTSSVLLPYTNILSSTLKELEPTGANFKTVIRNRVYIPTLLVERKVPGGKIHREKHRIKLNGIVYQIEAIVPFPMQFESSIMYKLHLTDDEPSEQPQGSEGA